MPRALPLLIATLQASCFWALHTPLDPKLAVRQRATFDFNCAAGDLEITTLQESKGYGHSTGQYGVRGCGRQTVYHAGCDPNDQCSVVMDSPNSASSR